MRRKGVLILATLAMLVSATGAWAGGIPFQWSENGHYYDLVVVDDVMTWDEAKTNTEVATWLGLPGHLATITSEEENKFITDKLDTSKRSGNERLIGLWIGGYQTPPLTEMDPAADWHWVTGEAWSYTNWQVGQPDNSDGLTGKENHLIFWDNNDSDSGRQWNDLDGDYKHVDDDLGFGYVVEYEMLVAQAPVPAAVWLLGSGLLGIVGIRRKISKYS